MKNTYGGDDDHRYLYTKNAPNGAIMLTSKYPSSQRNSMARGKYMGLFENPLKINLNTVDNYSPSSAASGEECCESRPERKKLPAKYECEYCGKYFNRPSSLKVIYQFFQITWNLWLIFTWRYTIIHTRGKNVRSFLFWVNPKLISWDSILLHLSRLRSQL